MGDFLFDEFEPVSAKQWKQKIQVELQGASYNETLVWTSPEGLHIKPFYHSDDYHFLESTNSKTHASIGQQVFIAEVEKAIFIANDALARGATALEFEAASAFDVKALLKGVNLDHANSICFNLHFFSPAFLNELLDSTKGVKTFLNIDPIGHFAQSGNWFSNSETDLQQLKKLVSKTKSPCYPLAVDISLYQNAGATSIQELAYGLAHANEYLNLLSDESLKKMGSLQFSFAIGSNYFSEIAKLRAFRHLWKLLCETYQIDLQAHIYAKPSLRNKTIYDYNSNMLRTTTECMSALLGGADTVGNLAYDAVYHKKNEFGERIARNQLLILKEESYFKEAATYAEGAYYIETLTAELAERALVLFKDIEKSGGFLAQLNNGTIQRKIKESASKEQLQFDKGDLALIGSNKFQNVDDKMKTELELYPFIKMNKRKTIIEPIVPIRLSQELEKQRLKNE